MSDFGDYNSASISVSTSKDARAGAIKLRSLCDTKSTIAYADLSISVLYQRPVQRGTIQRGHLTTHNLHYELSHTATPSQIGYADLWTLKSCRLSRLNSTLNAMFPYQPHPLISISQETHWLSN